MSEIVCEDLAHKSGFQVSVGNWICPKGFLISGTNYDTHHWETLTTHLGEEPQTSNQLSFMNKKIEEGYIRLVFRADVLFQVGCSSKDQLWSENPSYKRLMDILRRLTNTEIHIFSKTFYVIGKSDDIVSRNLSKLQIKERCENI